eukprot:10230214-Lingulodinium_polyedra.AAC.1
MTGSLALWIPGSPRLRRRSLGWKTRTPRLSRASVSRAPPGRRNALRPAPVPLERLGVFRAANDRARAAARVAC